MVDDTYLLAMKAPAHCCVLDESYSSEIVKALASVVMRRYEIRRDTTCSAGWPSWHLSESPYDAISTYAQAWSNVRLAQTCSIAMRTRLHANCSALRSARCLCLHGECQSGLGLRSQAGRSFTAKRTSTRFQRSADNATMQKEMHRSQRFREGP